MGIDSSKSRLTNKMAARVRQTWRAMDGVQRYMAVSGAAGATAGVWTGVSEVLEGRPAPDAAMSSIATFATVGALWPAAAAVSVVYVPLKALETGRAWMRPDA